MIFFRKNKASVSIEMIFVFIPILMLMFMFFNLLILLGNSMLTQSVANRGIQQVAALGCMPPDLEADLQKSTRYLGVTDTKLTVITTGRSWNHKSYVDPNGKVMTNNSSARRIPDCSGNETPVNSGDYIYLQLEYDQVMFFMPVSEVTMRSNALMISNTYGGEG